MKAEEEDPGLLFRWQRPKSLLFWLPWFVLASLLAHAGTFFLFSVVYPDRASIPPLPPRITLLTASTPENRALLDWIEAHDPALNALPVRLEPPNLFKASYRPSFEVIRTQPTQLDEESARHPLPAEIPALRIIHSLRPPADAAAAPAIFPALTTIKFSPELAARAPDPLPTIVTPKSGVPLEPARFLIGVSERGEVRFWFLQKPTGNPKLDEAAASQLAQLQFAHDSKAITWGMATVIWGEEAYPAPSAP